MTDKDALIQYAETKNADAFQYLVTTYQGMVYSACWRVLTDAAAVPGMAVMPTPATGLAAASSTLA